MKKRAIPALLVLAALALLGADLSGTWTADVVLDAGSGTATFTFKQTGDKLSGTYSGTFGQSPVSGTVKGDKVECAINGTVVGTYERSALVTDGKLKSTDGVYGIRFAHNTDALVTGFALTRP